MVESDGKTVGLIVDLVTEMLTVSADEIEAPGEFAGPSSPASALARAGTRLILILDTGRLCDAAAAFA